MFPRSLRAASPGVGGVAGVAWFPFRSQVSAGPVHLAKGNVSEFKINLAGNYPVSKAEPQGGHGPFLQL